MNSDDGIAHGYGWRSSLEAFSTASPRVVRGRLADFVRDATAEQLRAWDRSIPFLQQECAEYIVGDAVAAEYTAILEYELPRDFRRPDMIVLQHGGVAVMELKGYPYPTQSALDQVRGYARDLSAYHEACAGAAVVPVLVVGESPRPRELRDGVHVVSPDMLDALLAELADRNRPEVSAQAFLSPDAYAPLPGIVHAARELFNKRPLPMIKRARAATEPALDCITRVAHEAARTKSRHLVLLSGVPGSGKTLVGLQLVHAGWLDDLAVERPGKRAAAPAVYLSGNAPLVEVLQHALKDGGGGGRTFVQGVKQYVSYHERRPKATPPEHLIVFDEAQRAHDAARAAKVHKTEVGPSEPELLLKFATRIPEWSVLVALIGDGQAIHAGEEGGVPLWAEALSKVMNADRGIWHVHASPRLAASFRQLRVQLHESNALDLDTEIRFHLTPQVHAFVDGLLGGRDIDGLRTIARTLNDGGHRFLLTRSLESAKRYLEERYADGPGVRYGLLASAKDRWLVDHDVDNSFQTTKRLRVGPWYNAPKTDPRSCCRLETVATEFSSQGLELDFALLAWGSDLVVLDGKWSDAYARGSRDPIRDPMTMRRNVYRVLLTRGRDGTVVFVPPDARLDGVAERLLQAGFRPLHESRA